MRSAGLQTRGDLVELRSRSAARVLGWAVPSLQGRGTLITSSPVGAVVVCAALTAGLTACVPNDIVALWHMDETSGSVMHDAVGDNDGQLSSVQLGEPGLFGTAYGFTGNSKVTVPSSDALNAGSADLTVTIALKATETPDSHDWDLIRKGKARCRRRALEGGVHAQRTGLLRLQGIQEERQTSRPVRPWTTATGTPSSASRRPRRSSSSWTERRSRSRSRSVRSPTANRSSSVPTGDPSSSRDCWTKRASASTDKGAKALARCLCRA